MKVQVRVISNPHNIGNGYWKEGRVFDVISETECYYILAGNHRVNKRHLAIAGTACGCHSVKVKVLSHP